MNKKQKKMLFRIICAAALLIATGLIPLDGWGRFVVFLIPYLIIGYDLLIGAVRGVINRHPFDENFLMALATVGAMALGEYTEGVAVMLFYQTGELFQSYAVGKSRKSISALMDIRPDFANLEGDNGEVTTVSPDEVEPGSVILVRAGEKIPIDGVVVSGNTSLDTAALTGESAPRTADTGDAVLSGCVNIEGDIRIRTSCEFHSSTASKISELAENAGMKKARSEQFISRFAKYYTPAVCFLALVLCVLPPVFRTLVLKLPAELGVWFYRALTFLVISCPCALVISIPLSFFAGIGGASRAGVLVKGSDCIEALAKVRYVAFDKTGTLTRKKFSGAVFEEIKPEAKAAVAALYHAGVKKTVMLSGDKKSIGEAVATEIGINKAYCELLPSGKVEICEKLLAEKKKGETVAFVGDGINDAPVLARVDVGIAMGALGSDAAIEAADVVLMDDNPEKIAKAVKIARKCMGIVYQNIYFAIGIKLLCLVLGAAGIANMWLAIFADVGVMVLAVLNAVRALYVKKL
ncbi:MAG: HAD-IC family P-type ATPase [Oscillospiraceae bacterium]|nr:HAD-IC family P-type ATPase [Oscillospiraceae bacterium]